MFNIDYCRLQLFLLQVATEVYRKEGFQILLQVLVNELPSGASYIKI